MKILNIYSDFKKFEPIYDNWKVKSDLENKKAGLRKRYGKH